MSNPQLKPLEKASGTTLTPLKPTVSKFGPFLLRKDGVFHTTITKSGAKEAYICAPLEIVAHSRDDNGQEWGYVLQWKDPDDHLHKWSVSRSAVVKTGTEVAEALAKGGLNIAPKQAAKVREYISSVNPQAKVLNVPRPGWHKPKGKGKVFVLPRTTVSDGQGETIILQETTYDPLAQRVCGSLDDWKNNVASRCNGNDILTFAVSLAFASPTLELLKRDSGGFHLHGLSSSGKSTALHVGTSVWGYPVQTWRTTDNALEDTAERHNDVLLPLDELSQVDPKKAAEVAYMLGNGEGKQRLTQSIIPQAKKKWRLIFLSTGEITLADHVETAGKRTKAGTEVRMVNIDADAGKGMGVFGDIHDASSPAAFADSLKEAAEKNCGKAGPAFVEFLIKNEKDAVEKMQTRIAEFKHKHVPSDASGEIYRVVDRFALVGAAGELATEAGVSGWAPGQAMGAAARLFQAWLSKRSTGSSDMDKAVAQICGFLLANPDRFESLREDGGLDSGTNRTVVKRVGFKKLVSTASPDSREKRYEYFVTTTAFKTELCQGHDPTKVAKELAKRGFLRRDKDRLQVQIRVEDVGKVRCYAIQPSIFEEGNDDDVTTEQVEVEPVLEAGSSGAR